MHMYVFLARELVCYPCGAVVTKDGHSPQNSHRAYVFLDVDLSLMVFGSKLLVALRPSLQTFTRFSAMAVQQRGSAGSATTGSLFGAATLVYERDQVLTGKAIISLKIKCIPHKL